jgi:two-component system, OmpR family, phosphate regulon response regulator PhoB
MKPRILIVEDDPALSELLSYNLDKAGFEPAVAEDGEEALLMVAERTPDLILLDWMLPRTSGIEVCRRIRRQMDTRHVPVIMLTARGEESDKVRGLDNGADDYITKPFSSNELISRIHAAIRRARPALGAEALHFADLVMDLVDYRVHRKGRQVHVGPTEFRLLRHLMEHPKRVFSRERLLDAVWGQDADVGPRTVDAYVRRLRKALNGLDEVDLIRTVREAGYSLDDADGREASSDR